MIRYVLAVVLTVAILSLAAIAIDASRSDNTERQLQTEIADIERNAVALVEYEELSPEGHPDPQRVVEVSVPARSLTAEGVSHFEIEPLEEADASVARYVLDDGTTNQVLVDQRIVYRDPTDNRTAKLGGAGTQRIRLVLLPDENGDPVVVVEPPEVDGFAS